MRVGIGYDVHRLVEGRPLILGGVNIPCSLGLKGYSDADVLLHALADALLGAAGLGDIGQHFPDTDPKYQGIYSLTLLQEVGKKLREAGLLVNNIDAVIIAERPKMAPYLRKMQNKIAEALQVEPRAINLKATTTEGLGLTGRGEGIAAQAVVTLMEGLLVVDS